MQDPIWNFTHSVKASVPRRVAWRWWSDVANWSDPPYEFSLEGAFASGTWGVSRAPGQPPVRWRLREVEPEAGAVIETALEEKAVLAVRWRFDDRPGGGTRISQHWTLTGENAESYREGMRAFEANVPEGMRRIAGLLEDFGGDNFL